MTKFATLRLSLSIASIRNDFMWVVSMTHWPSLRFARHWAIGNSGVPTHGEHLWLANSRSDAVSDAPVYSLATEPSNGRHCAPKSRPGAPGIMAGSIQKRVHGNVVEYY